MAQRAAIVALVVAAVGGALAAYLVSANGIEEQRADRIGDARDDLEAALAARTFYLEDVADMVGVHDDADSTEFSRYARVRSPDDGSVVGVQWLRGSPDGKLVPPAEVGQDPMLVAPSGDDLSLAHADEQRIAERTIRSASVGKRAAISPPVELSNGDPGFYLAVPIEARKFSGAVSQVESQSAIVGLIDAPEMVASTFGDEASVAVEDSSGTDLVTPAEELDGAVSDGVDAIGRDWQITVAGGQIPAFERALPALLLACGLALALVVALFLRSAVRRRDIALGIAHEREEELERRSREDALTGIFNRRHFSDVLAQELEREDGGNAAVLLLDLDDFKRVNDEHGHLTGDVVLQAVAQRLASVLRGPTCLARWGGEEFAVLAPSADRPAAAALAERLRRAIADDPAVIDGIELPLTLSVGVAFERDGLTTPDAIVDAADRALYWAKDAGRNCVRLWSAEDAAEPPGAPQVGGAPKQRI